MKDAARRDIGDYAMIGDCETAALVSREGSIDWLCWPRFDSPACMAALLGDERNGRWQIAPVEEARASRRYRPGTLILETRFETKDAAVLVIDFMPLRKQASDIMRIVVGERGRMRMRSDMALRFDYGRLEPLVSEREQGLVAIAGPNAVTLASPIDIGLDGNGSHRTEFEVGEGDRVPFVMTYFASHLPAPDATEPEAALRDTEAFWTEWVSRSRFEGSFAEAAQRSLITLKALTYRPTGGVLAAPTTSLPERWEGERNWDYRYCWLRDATFTLLSLLDAGYQDEAVAWRDWLLRAVAGDPSNVQPVYGLAGEHRLMEWEVDWLPGFAGAAPVRVGNAAFKQHQLDVFGEVLDALHQAREAGLEEPPSSWRLQQRLVDHLEKIWREPDDGIWESRAGPERFTHSQVMAWVGVDRAVKAVEHFGLEGPLERWRGLRDEIHREVCERGFDAELNAFTRSFSSRNLDAATLMIPLVGFLPADDPRVAGTVDAIQKHLMKDGLVLRYDTQESPDGLPAGEGAFLACSFWLVDNLVLLGRREEAEKLFEHLLSLRNDVGLLAEEYDPKSGRQMGNFPQALSHVALVDSVFNLARGKGPAMERGTGR